MNSIYGRGFRYQAHSTLATFGINPNLRSSDSEIIQMPDGISMNRE